MNHLSETELILYLKNKLSEEKRLQVEKHLAECDTCLSEFWELHQFEKELISSNPPAVKPEILEEAKNFASPKKKSEFQSLLRSKIMIAAAVLLLSVFVAVAYFLVSSDSNEIQTYRSENESIVIIPVYPEDEALVQSKSIMFTWQAVENAALYRLRLFDQNGIELSALQVPDSSYDLSASGLLEPGNRYLWRVEVIMPDQREFRSELRSLTYQTDD